MLNKSIIGMLQEQRVIACHLVVIHSLHYMKENYMSNDAYTVGACIIIHNELIM